MLICSKKTCVKHSWKRDNLEQVGRGTQRDWTNSMHCVIYTNENELRRQLDQQTVQRPGD